MIQEIGTITELGPLPFVLSVRTHPSPVIAGRPFIVRIMTDTRPNNANVDAVELRPESPEVRFTSPAKSKTGRARAVHLSRLHQGAFLLGEAASGAAWRRPPARGTVWPNLEVSNGYISGPRRVVDMGALPGRRCAVDGEVHIRSRCQTPRFPTGDSVDLIMCQSMCGRE